MSSDNDDDALLVFDTGDDDRPPAGIEVFAEAAAAPKEPPPPYFATAEAWMRGWMSTAYARELRGVTHRVWCPFWWEHTEAVLRIEALWRAWEHLRLEPTTGMAVWWKDYADPHMAQLFAPDGPFQRCGPGRHEVLPRLPLADPGELFTPTEERKPNVLQRIIDAIRS